MVVRCLFWLQGTLLRRLHPCTTAEAARCMLAMLAAGVGCHNANGTVTLPAIKAVLAQVLEAQQFPVSCSALKQQRLGTWGSSVLLASFRYFQTGVAC
jgi:2C-methyl-D-erythritol 2,4-cyclodiphosphate synthase